MSSSNSKKEKKNTKALFSIVCLCIVSLGLIVYFSTTSANNSTVNQPTTIKESTTEVQHPITLKETTTKNAVSTQAYTKQATKKPATTQAPTMKLEKSNTPYKSYYKYPLTDVVSKGYSEELVYDETMGDYRAHAAVDFSAKAGDKVCAINDGLVQKVYTDAKYGMCVQIDHGGNLVANYCGMDSVSVQKGDYVDIGNKIGTVGKVPCEGADKPHLHFETRVKDKLVNPLDVMSKTE